MNFFERAIAPRLGEIRAKVAQGAGPADIAELLGLSAGHLMRIADKNVTLMDALGLGDWVDRQVEQALFSIATGGAINDCTYELRTNDQGKQSLRCIKKVVKAREPDLAAVRLWLSTRAADRWTALAGPEPATNRSLPELLREAKALIGELET